MRKEFLIIKTINSQGFPQIFWKTFSLLIRESFLSERICEVGLKRVVCCE